jgi:hypothetical protein
VNEFLEFLGKKKTNYYQIRKLVDFLKSLQSLPPSKGSFESIVIFPYLKVTREKAWNVELAVSEKVYLYRYPFYFPEEFLSSIDTYDLRAKIFFFLSFGTTELEKELWVEELLNQADISGLRVVKLRKAIVKTFQDAQDFKLIEPRFTILTKTNKTKEVDKLTSNSLSRANSIRYTEIP